VPEEDKLARKASKSKASGKRVSKAKRRKVSAKAPASLVYEEDHIDGCDVEFHDGDASPDAALPVTRGGWQNGRGRAGWARHVAR
jgi:hypothetical protein